ncbi:MAG: TolC family protein, partial [Elusimicrobia bacterium]|nr:TolC family protein [Elusimicrobiota bacterium]
MRRTQPQFVRLAAIAIPLLVGVAGPLSAAPATAAAAVATSTRTIGAAEAIELAIQSNIGSRLAAAQTEEERGKAIKEAAGLLPKISGAVAVSRTFQLNLEAQGFPATGGFNPLLGPYNTFDARVSLSQPLLDLAAYWRWRAAKTATELSRLEEDLTKEQVASASALAFIDLIRAHRSVDTAAADLKLAQTLLDLARDQRHAGLSSGVDVARADTRLAEARLRAIQAGTDERQASIRLARVTGLPLETRLVPADNLSGPPVPAPSVDTAISEARNGRLETKMSELLVKQESASLAEARAGHAPSIVAGADGGESGSSLNSSKPVGSVGARLDLPIYAGGAAAGKTKEAAARLEAAKLRRDDIRKQIEEDVRLACETLAAE